MPFVSEAQRRYLWMHHPSVAKRWAHEHPGQHDLPYHKRKKEKQACLLAAALAAGLPFEYCKTAADEPPNYRPSDMQDRACGLCDYFDGHSLCQLYNVNVAADHVCDSFTNEATKLGSLVKRAFGFGDALPPGWHPGDYEPPEGAGFPGGRIPFSSDKDLERFAPKDVARLVRADRHPYRAVLADTYLGSHGIVPTSSRFVIGGGIPAVAGALAGGIAGGVSSKRHGVQRALDTNYGAMRGELTGAGAGLGGVAGSMLGGKLGKNKTLAKLFGLISGGTAGGYGGYHLGDAWVKGIRKINRDPEHRSFFKRSALIKRALFPNQGQPGNALPTQSMNPGPAAPNSASGIGLPPQQPLTSPQPQDQSQGSQQPQQAPPPQQAGGFKPSIIGAFPSENPDLESHFANIDQRLGLQTAPPPPTGQQVADGTQMHTAQALQKHARDLLGKHMRLGRESITGDLAKLASIVKLGQGWGQMPGMPQMGMVPQMGQPQGGFGMNPGMGGQGMGGPGMDPVAAQQAQQQAAMQHPGLQAVEQQKQILNMQLAQAPHNANVMRRYQQAMARLNSHEDMMRQHAGLPPRQGQPQAHAQAGENAEPATPPQPLPGQKPAVPPGHDADMSSTQAGEGKEGPGGFTGPLQQRMLGEGKEGPGGFTGPLQQRMLGEGKGGITADPYAGGNAKPGPAGPEPEAAKGYFGSQHSGTALSTSGQQLGATGQGEGKGFNKSYDTDSYQALGGEHVLNPGTTNTRLGDIDAEAKPRSGEPLDAHADAKGIGPQTSSMSHGEGKGSGVPQVSVTSSNPAAGNEPAPQGPAAQGQAQMNVLAPKAREAVQAQAPPAQPQAPAPQRSYTSRVTLGGLPQPTPRVPTGWDPGRGAPTATPSTPPARPAPNVQPPAAPPVAKAPAAAPKPPTPPKQPQTTGINMGKGSASIGVAKAPAAVSKPIAA
jgi:hypothetical protein